jgi:hypothetical protein
MQSHISMSRALRTALLAAAGALLGLPGGTIADTDLGPVTASGEIELGYQGVGDDWSSAKFEQYRDESPGLIARGLFLLEDEEATRFFRGWFDQLTRDDQEYLFQAGRYGRYRLEFGLSQFYQTFSNNALTPYGSPGEETRLVLPPGFALSSPFDRDNMETQLSTFSFNPELRFRQRNYTTGISLWATPELLLRSDYELRDRDGTRPHALGFGSAGGRFVNFRAPVDDHTNNWSGDILLLRERWNLEFDYSGSSYDNDADSVTLESPFTPTVPLGDTTQGRISRDPETVPLGDTTQGRISRDPDNTLHQFSLSGSTELPGEMPARLAGTLSYGRLTQDESFLPHSANPAPGAANPPLPQSDLDGKVNTLLGNLVLTHRAAAHGSQPEGALSLLRLRQRDRYDRLRGAGPERRVQRAGGGRRGAAGLPPADGVARGHAPAIATGAAHGRVRVGQLVPGGPPGHAPERPRRPAHGRL